jgi:hypothetical protein
VIILLAGLAAIGFFNAGFELALCSRTDSGSVSIFFTSVIGGTVWATMFFFEARKGGSK